MKHTVVYEDWKTRSEQARGEVYAQFNIKPGTTEARLLDKMHQMHDRLAQAAATTDYKLNQEALIVEQAQSTQFFDEIRDLHVGNQPEKIASARTAQAAYDLYKYKLEGPNLAQRLLSEPYVDRESGEAKWSGIAGALAGAVSGWVMAGKYGAGFIKTAITTVVMGVLGGAGASFIGELVSGKKEEAPKEPETTPNNPPITGSPEIPQEVKNQVDMYRNSDVRSFGAPRSPQPRSFGGPQSPQPSSFGAPQYPPQRSFGAPQYPPQKSFGAPRPQLQRILGSADTGTPRFDVTSNFTSTDSGLNGLNANVNTPDTNNPTRNTPKIG